ncbi:uncharacterized protein MEPE_04646 [Melanopsichium pennsylvanicum]|uniref:Uncharacterized protein n=1 Tax=Melanopsichium pennsylvanicum TaxID=63383 RepID=A0AAJ5C6K3_9BASI|nr:uncharacterized protein MEPE_04646 [Melanopsichium pennsylvanicum]
MKSIIKAAVIVLSDAAGSQNSIVGPHDALEQDVSLFLRSLQHFPAGHLPFATEAYSKFFCLVAEWRNEAPSIDARHTIDTLRKWLEIALSAERDDLDRRLIGYPEFWGGPCALTIRLLFRLAAFHEGEACGEELTKAAHVVLDSLERASETVKDGSGEVKTVMGLLGILLDAFAGINWAEKTIIGELTLADRAARLLGDLIWCRDEMVLKIALGILHRLKARGRMWSFAIAEQVSAAIVDKLAAELDRTKVDMSESPLMSLGVAFETCLDILREIDEARAIFVIQEDFLNPLSSLLSRILERTVHSSSEEHLAELDAISTGLYNLCYDAVHDV